MSMKTKKIAVGALLFLLAGTMTGCGKTKIDVMEDLEVAFSGVDGYGTAAITNEYDWEEEALEAIGGSDPEDVSFLGDMMKIESAVSFEISPSEGLSNGDTVTVKVSVDNEKIKKYRVAFKAGEKKFTVEGLKEIEQLDLFENVDVEFQGVAPYVKASIKNESGGAPVYVGYTLDKSENLTVGDAVTVTAEYDENRLLEQGYTVGEETKEFVVPECDRYVTRLAEIPEEMTGKMNKQFEDALRADAAKNWSEDEHIKSIECIGNYLLTPKDGIDISDKNIFYGVYKVVAENPEQEVSYYSYCMFRNIIVLKDGTCSVDLAGYRMPEGAAWLYGKINGEAFYAGEKYWYVGYEKLDSLFNNCVTKNIEQYEYESSVTE